MKKQLAERRPYSQGSWWTVTTLSFPVAPCATACCEIMHFQWLFLVPAETRPAYTWTLYGGRCALHTATKPNQPVCLGIHITDCMESCQIQMMSNGHLLIQAVSCVCECDTWVEASLRPYQVSILTLYSENGVKEKAQLLGSCCAIYLPFVTLVNVRKIGTQVPLLGISNGKCFHILGDGLWDTPRDLETMNAFSFKRKVQNPHLSWVKSRKVSSVKICRRR